MALVWCASCDSCDQGEGGRRGGTDMCGKCARSADCGPKLSCLVGVCETAPPSCHVKIGL